MSIELTHASGAKATILPEKGFNLISLQVPHKGELVDVIHSEPDITTTGSPTHSGIPVLFPFPNRIAKAKYSWAGKDYELPSNIMNGPNAIHGFACGTAWQNTSAAGSTATGTFRLSVDAAASADTWPGDLELALRYELNEDGLTIHAKVTNVDSVDVPFGLGFHPYFAPLDRGTGRAAAEMCRLECPAEQYWVLDDTSIPTGETKPVSGDLDLRGAPVVGSRQLDDVLTDLPPANATGLTTRGELLGAHLKTELQCDANWRDIVVFTPANRESVAIEPYTCPTDAIHLTQRGQDVGWKTLAPGEVWEGVVQIVVSEIS